MGIGCKMYNIQCFKHLNIIINNIFDNKEIDYSIEIIKENYIKENYPKLKIENYHYFFISNVLNSNKSIIIFDFDNNYPQFLLNQIAIDLAPDLRVNSIIIESKNYKFDENQLIELFETIIYLANAKNLTAQKIHIEVKS